MNSPGPRQRSALDFEVPLLRLKDVSFRDETTVGIYWNHTLGDATAFLRFTHAFSKAYTPSIHRLRPRSPFSLSLRSVPLKNYAR
ncbi:hypothetical protein BDR05DRAFT_1000826 [Suillus weaverae]|nr:hypothetical protein BDR05DRAFT_1000823 [Suillus weaverae]KAG2342509.1 hypothetical protein BDR05DRAFT_1000826 [Suillus weaverae]